jgi:type VII secretion protein EccB
MQNRKDLLQAHRLMTQRAALALLCGEPDSPNQPLRRRNTATITGILAGVVTAVVFAVLGLLSQGKVADLTKPGTLVFDKNTGQTYVPCQNGELCPALNYASALLALTGQNPDRVDVTQGALATYGIGPAFGIPYLPDLPTEANLVKGPWSVCDQGRVSTLVGGASVGGTQLSPTQAVLAAATAQDGQQQDWLLWNGQRLQIDPQVADSLLSTPGNVPIVSTAWVDAFPQGPDYAAPAINDAGRPVASPAGDGTAQVGWVFYALNATGQRQYYVLMATGKLMGVSLVQAHLLENASNRTAQQIPESTALNDLSPGASPSLPLGGLPRQLSQVSTIASLTCVVDNGPGRPLQIKTGGALPAGAENVKATGANFVNQVSLPQLRGALIAVTPGPGSTTKSLFLVTGATRYPVPSAAVEAVLGYNLTDETPLPASFEELIPQGATLNRQLLPPATRAESTFITITTFRHAPSMCPAAHPSPETLESRFGQTGCNRTKALFYCLGGAASSRGFRATAHTGFCNDQWLSRSPLTRHTLQKNDMDIREPMMPRKRILC